MCARAEVRSGESQDTDDAERHRGPEQPWAEFAPAGSGPICDDAHHGIETRDAQPHDEEEGSRLGRGQAKGVGVEVQLQGQHGLKDKIRGHVAESVAGFFTDGKLLNHMCLVVPCSGVSSLP